MAKKEIVETDEQKKNREAVQSIAKNIASLSRAVAALLNGPLKKDALVVLIANSSGLSQNNVREVLKALQELEGRWLNS